jgi:hypothetical protein
MAIAGRLAEKQHCNVREKTNTVFLWLESGKLL